MDYKKLLERYMQRVYACRQDTYVRHCFTGVYFNEEEDRILLSMERALSKRRAEEALKNQKFAKMDLVQIADEMPPHMAHFTSGCRAIVLATYAQRFGGDNVDSYNLYLEGRGSVSWYHEDQLTLLSSNRSDILEKWKEEAAAKETLESDLDWIFGEGAAGLLQSASGATCDSLANYMGILDLWGAQGEGFVYQRNARTVLQAAIPFLKNSDKAGWLEFCESVEAAKIRDYINGTKDKFIVC